MNQIRSNSQGEVLVLYTDDTPDVIVIDLITSKPHSLLNNYKRAQIEEMYPVLIEQDVDLSQLIKIGWSG